ncbi:SfnB family sulfur acquisition oxidoreductase [Actinomadura parmotrematis]|uniref:SfnB family sulfur acquisition oxidoreductase n=1 Tax=Actinomadura parmotrematis TaxID=2864039 RepID=A0ABS7FPI3_9ACTN|nr:SfnB family sulfur acquisition oxidoreductase [Actinomadura parmotrematis]MBW8482313.1 SfnB family sulfur acquisition oxidoreductase [Actinomadura parmotrematis]
MTVTSTPVTGVKAAPPALDDAAAVEAARAFAARIAPGAVERDRTARHPAAELDDLAGTGLLAISVPREHGGGGVAASTVGEVFRIVAAADPSVAQLVLAHFVLVALIGTAASEEQKAFFHREVVGGARIGNATAERGTKHVFDRRTAVTPGPDGGYRLDGRKYYTTGALGADWIGVAASVEGDQNLPVTAFVPGDAAGLEFGDDWSAFGQRATASGSLVLTGVDVPANRVLHLGPVPADPPPLILGAYDQLLHLAIDVGIARAALEEGAAFVRDRSRPWFESGVDSVADEPHAVLRFGRLTTLLHALEALFERAGRAVDAAYAAPELTDGNTAAASLAVAEAKAYSQEVAVQIAADVIELAGTSAADAAHGLDRHWRNVRTHSLHDPARWKYVHIGNHTLRGTNPPRYPLL